MKRLLPAIFFVLLLGTNLVHSQFIEGMGLKAGLSLANQSHRITPLDYTLNTEPVTGPAIAIFMEALRGKHLSFQTDLAFVRKGSKTTTESITVNHLENDKILVSEGDLKISKFYYLSLAPMARYRIGKNRVIPYGLLGPRLDLLLKYSTDSDYPLEEQNRFILGLSAGLGVEYNLDKLGVFIEFQFQPDLSPVTNKDPLLINNNILLFTLGIRYMSAD